MTMVMGSHCQVHDGVDNVVVTFLQSLNRLGLGAIGLLHNQLDVLRFHTFLIDLI